jgi:hypothetical protein
VPGRRPTKAFALDCQCRPADDSKFSAQIKNQNDGCAVDYVNKPNVCVYGPQAPRKYSEERAGIKSE